MTIRVKRVINRGKEGYQNSNREYCIGNKKKSIPCIPKNG